MEPPLWFSSRMLMTSKEVLEIQTHWNPAAPKRWSRRPVLKPFSSTVLQKNRHFTAPQPSQVSNDIFGQWTPATSIGGKLWYQLFVNVTHVTQKSYGVTSHLGMDVDSLGDTFQFIFSIVKRLRSIFILCSFVAFSPSPPSAFSCTIWTRLLSGVYECHDFQGLNGIWIGFSKLYILHGCLWVLRCG